MKHFIDTRSTYLRYVLIISFLLLTALAALFFYACNCKTWLQQSEKKIKKVLNMLASNNENQASLKMEDLKEVVQLAVSNDPGFLLKFNACDPGFCKKLTSIAPSLVATEIEFCALLRLNFETKEIARYTNTSVRAVEGKKYRIRKKLNILSDQDINLWMTHLEYENKN